jgi:hypothetical protein
MTPSGSTNAIAIRGSAYSSSAGASCILLWMIDSFSQEYPSCPRNCVSIGLRLPLSSNRNLSAASAFGRRTDAFFSKFENSLQDDPPGGPEFQDPEAIEYVSSSDRSFARSCESPAGRQDSRRFGNPNESIAAHRLRLSFLWLQLVQTPTAWHSPGCDGPVRRLLPVCFR